MRKDSYWDTLGDALAFVDFLMILPVIIVIFLVVIGIALINRQIIAFKVDKDTTILYSHLEDTVYNIAKEKVDNDKLMVQLSDSNFKTHSVELEYILKSYDYSAEECDNLLKQEITNVYNEIKDKELVNDTLFGEDEDLEKITIGFSLHYDEKGYYYLGSDYLRYSFADKWSTRYNEVMENVIVNQKNWEENRPKETG